jgi:hypothetical protein
LQVSFKALRADVEYLFRVSEFALENKREIQILYSKR